MADDIGTSFLMPICINISSLVKYLFKYFTHLLLSSLLPYTEFWKLIIYFRHKLLIRYMTCKHFLTVCSLSFYSLSSVFHRANILVLIKPSVLKFSLNLRNFHLITCCKDFTMLSSSICVVLFFTFCSRTYLAFTLVYRMQIFIFFTRLSIYLCITILKVYISPLISDVAFIMT